MNHIATKTILSISDILAHYFGNHRTRKELLVLQVISGEHDGLVGADIIKSSNNALKRGTIYGLLERMEDKQLITGETVQTNKRRFPQRLYKITAHGAKMLAESKEELFSGLLAISQ